jgi:hypothetical protein
MGKSTISITIFNGYPMKNPHDFFDRTISDLRTSLVDFIPPGALVSGQPRKTTTIHPRIKKTQFNNRRNKKLRVINSDYRYSGTPNCFWVYSSAVNF